VYYRRDKNFCFGFAPVAEHGSRGGVEQTQLGAPCKQIILGGGGVCEGKTWEPEVYPDMHPRKRGMGRQQEKKRAAGYDRMWVVDAPGPRWRVIVAKKGEKLNLIL